MNGMMKREGGRRMHIITKTTLGTCSTQASTESVSGSVPYKFRALNYVLAVRYAFKADPETSILPEDGDVSPSRGNPYDSYW